MSCTNVTSWFRVFVFSAFDAFAEKFLDCAGRHSGLPHGNDAAAQLPLRSDFVDRGGHHRIGIGLAVQFAGDFGHFGEAVHVGRFSRLLPR